MANRAPSLDPLVFSIADLEKLGSEKLSRECRGEWLAGASCSLITVSGFSVTDTPGVEYYNEGAMDLVTYVTICPLDWLSCYPHQG